MLTAGRPPRVSVIVPTRNRASVLPRAVGSVLAQTFAEFELTIVDDGSSDDTPAVIAGFADPRIATLRHDRARGQSGALNAGIARARGAYIAFLDDDDEWRPDKLALQVAALDAAPPDVGLVHGWRDIVDEAENQTIDTVRQTLRGDIFERMLMLDGPVSPSSWLVRASAARSIGGFDEDRTMAIDVDFVCRLSRQGWHVDCVERVVAVQYKHWRGQLTDGTGENLAGRAAQVRGHMARFSRELRDRPASLAKVHLVLARRELARGRLLSVLASVASAFRYDPVGTGGKFLRHWRLAVHLARRAIRGPAGRDASSAAAWYEDRRFRRGPRDPGGGG